jgi:DNA-binding transcriptional regulator YdaS (Cro superfamily)
MENKTPTPIQNAVALAGGVSPLARACNVSPQAVYKWVAKGRPPVERCVAVEEATQGRVSRYDLLPPALQRKGSL